MRIAALILMAMLSHSTYSSELDFKFNKDAAVLYSKAVLTEYLDWSKQSRELINTEPTILTGIDKKGRKLITILYKVKKGFLFTNFEHKDDILRVYGRGGSTYSIEKLKKEFHANPYLFTDE